MKFKINSMGISVNQMYITKGRFRILSPKAREWKEKIKKEIVNQINKKEREELKKMINQKLYVSLVFISSTWLNKDETIKKKDCASYEKITCDTFFEALREIEEKLDDKQIWDLHIKKKEGICEETYIELLKYVETVEVRREL